MLNLLFCLVVFCLGFGVKYLIDWYHDFKTIEQKKSRPARRAALELARCRTRQRFRKATIAAGEWLF